MANMYRAQILLDPEQHKSLVEIARREGTSISEIVRSAVREWLDERIGDEILLQRLGDLQIIWAHRQALHERSGGQPLEIDIDGLIDQMRAERGDELLTSTFGKAK